MTLERIEMKPSTYNIKGKQNLQNCNKLQQNCLYLGHIFDVYFHSLLLNSDRLGVGTIWLKDHPSVIMTQTACAAKSEHSCF